MRSLITVPTLVLIALPLAAARAQGGERDRTRPAAESRPAAGSPFKADDVLRRLLDAPERRGAASSDRRRAVEERPAPPQLRLRGMLKMKGSAKPAALVEVVDGGVFVVREGDRVSTASGAGRSQGGARPPKACVLKIERVLPDGVIVEIEGFAERTVLR